MKTRDNDEKESVRVEYVDLVGTEEDWVESRGEDGREWRMYVFAPIIAIIMALFGGVFKF